MEQKIIDYLNVQFEGTQIALGVIKNAAVQFTNYHKQKNGIQKSKNARGIFEIGSITKVFTTYILAQFVLENRIALDDPIYKYLNIPALQKTGITFLQLANHTSGIPRLPPNFYSIDKHDEKNPYLHYDEAALLEYLNGDLQLESQAGKNFAYSNLGSGILSYTLSQIAGKPFASMVSERLFKPFGMQTSSFDRMDLPNDQLVSGLDQNGQPSNHWDGGILNGCIGIYSSVDDQTRFMLQIMDTDNPVANLQATPTIETKANHFVGLGWGISINEHFTAHRHGGGSNGYSGYMNLSRKKKNGIVLLTNISAFHPTQKKLEQLSRELMASLF